MATYRPDEIRKLINTIQPRTDIVYVNTFSVFGSPTYAVKGPSSFGDDYTKWRFPTLATVVEATYNEVWKPKEKNIYYLDQANLNLYVLEETGTDIEDKEYVFLHCEPNTGTNIKNYPYKQSPHLHIKHALEPIPHAHIALNLTDLSNTLDSCDNLNTAFLEATVLLRNEFILPLM